MLRRALDRLRVASDLPPARRLRPAMTNPNPNSMKMAPMKVPKTRKNSGGEFHSPNGAAQRKMQTVSPMSPKMHGMARPRMLTKVFCGAVSSICDRVTPDFHHRNAQQPNRVESLLDSVRLQVPVAQTQGPSSIVVYRPTAPVTSRGPHAQTVGLSVLLDRCGHNTRHANTVAAHRQNLVFAGFT